MNVNSQNLSSIRKNKTFNNPERFIEGWYWVLPSQNLRVGDVKAVTILGRELAIYRGKDKRVVTCDAYCPHMGAHLGEGNVKGNELRCFFHHWQFDAEGICVDIPCLDEPLPIKIRTWPTAEKYGLIWIWTGDIPKHPIPSAPELEYKELDFAFGPRIVMNSHPHVVMINAIDIQHFNTVHKLASDIVFEKQELHQNAITFVNTKYDGREAFFLKVIRPFYKNAITYRVCYWYGSTGIVTIGTDFLHVHIMFTLRLLEAGKSAAQSLIMIKKRQGIFGWLYNLFVLWLAKTFVKHFIQGDTKVFQTMQFNLKTPIKADQSIMQFINHLERQKPLNWGTWNLARSQNVEIRESREKWRDALSND
ncbi:MAG: Rieske 2Fe-2S domain-containing protein [Nodularia sp. CChRGM 3473]